MPDTWYTPVYVSEMRQLETKQPEMFKFLEQGGFVVRQSNESVFNSVPTDQALEQSINRDAKLLADSLGAPEERPHYSDGL